MEWLTVLNFSCCPHIIEVPDVSELPNLQNLNLRDCLNLVEVHDSVGHLDKLVSVDVSSCCNLLRFPRHMKSRFLELLHFSGCRQFKRLPDFPTRMNKLLHLFVNASGIEEFPPSMGNLTALKELDIRHCRKLRVLPCNTFIMQNLRELRFSETPLGNIFLEYAMCMDSISLISNTCNLMALQLRQCELSDEHLPVIPKLCPRLKVLDLAENMFQRIPECFRELSCLVELRMFQCQQLVKFPDILPYLPHMEYLDAGECRRLSLKSKINMLKSWEERSRYKNEKGCDSELDEDAYWHWLKNYEASPVSGIILPEMKIPNWCWQVRNRGRSLSFWARRKFPRFQLCILSGNSDERIYFPDLCLRVGDLFLSMTISWCSNHLLIMERNEMWEFYNERNRRYERVEKRLESEWDDSGGWNCVEIHCGIQEVEELCIKFESDMEDIRFSDASYGRDSSHTSTPF